MHSIFDVRSWNRLNHRLSRSAAIVVLLLGVLVLATLLLLTAPVLHIPVKITKNYNEGWVAYQAARAMDGMPLYPADSPCIYNNYPPLSAYMIGAVGRVIGDNIVAGRVLAFAGFLVASAMIGCVLRLMGRSRTAALSAAVLFAGYMVCYHETYIAMNDPQWMAHALMMSGIGLFIARRHRLSMLALAIFLMMTATMVKHSIIGFPAAATMWLFLYERRLFYYWVCFGLAALGAYMLLWHMLYGPAFFSNLFLTPRIYAIGLIPDKLIDWLPPLLPFMIAGLFAVCLNSQQPYLRLVLFYTSLSAVWGVFILGGAGTVYNVLFDVMIGLSLMCGMAVDGCADALNRLWPRHRVQVMVIAVSALSIAVALPNGLLKVKGTLDLSTREQLFQEEIAYVAAHRQPVACEDLALCYWAGKPFELDFFNYGQRLFLSDSSVDDFKQKLENHYYTLVQTNRPNCSERLPAPVNEYIRAAYYPAKQSSSGHTFFVPRGAR